MEQQEPLGWVRLRALFAPELRADKKDAHSTITKVLRVRLLLIHSRIMIQKAELFSTGLSEYAGSKFILTNPDVVGVMLGVGMLLRNHDARKRSEILISFGTDDLTLNMIFN